MSKVDILAELPRLKIEERQEILERLIVLQDEVHSATHQQWVDEAIASGPARPATKDDWEQALKKGLTRGR